MIKAIIFILLLVFNEFEWTAYLFIFSTFAVAISVFAVAFDEGK